MGKSIISYYKKVFDINFNYQKMSKDFILNNVGFNLFYYEDKNVFSGSSIIRDYNLDSVVNFIKTELKFKKCFIVYISNNFKLIDHQVEKYYKTLYKKVKVD